MPEEIKDTDSTIFTIVARDLVTRWRTVADQLEVPGGIITRGVQADAVRRCADELAGLCDLADERARAQARAQS
jgi:hypothetical protein